jgi:hypothetical protein
MPVTIEKIQKVAEASLATSRRKVQNVSRIDEAQARDTIMDIGTEQMAVYKLIVLATKDAITLAQVAAIWNEAVIFYRTMTVLWEMIRREQESPETKRLVEYYEKATARCLELSEGAYKFHSL